MIHALSDATRRQLLQRINSGLGSVGAISDALPMSAPAISKHLRVLESAGLIERQRSGRVHRFSVRRAPIEDAIGLLRSLLAETVSEESREQSSSGEIDVALL